MKRKILQKLPFSFLCKFLWSILSNLLTRFKQVIFCCERKIRTLENLAPCWKWCLINNKLVLNWAMLSSSFDEKKLLLLNKFFDSSSPSMRKGRYRGKRRKRWVDGKSFQLIIWIVTNCNGDRSCQNSAILFSTWTMLTTTTPCH